MSRVSAVARRGEGSPGRAGGSPRLGFLSRELPEAQSPLGDGGGFQVFIQSRLLHPPVKFWHLRSVSYAHRSSFRFVGKM